MARQEMGVARKSTSRLRPAVRRPPVRLWSGQKRPRPGERWRGSRTRTAALASPIISTPDGAPRRDDGDGRGEEAGILRRHLLPTLFACGMLFFMDVEYTIPMVPAATPLLDLWFVATAAMYAGIGARPWLSSLLAVPRWTLRIVATAAMHTGIAAQAWLNSLLPALSSCNWEG